MRPCHITQSRGVEKVSALTAQQNMPYASKPLYGAMRIRLTVEVRERFADRATIYRRSAAMSRAEGKFKKTSQSKRKAFVNDVVLNIKT